MNTQEPATRGHDASEPEWLTLGQAARFLGVAQSTIRKWSDQGRIPAFYTPGGHRRFRRVHLASFVEGSAPGGVHGGPLVLVIDDDAALSELLRLALEQDGYTVSEAANGDQALAAIAVKAPDLILLDLVMPGSDGWKLLRELQEHHGEIPLIMFSGKPDPGSQDADEEGSADPARQPFDPGELVGRAKKLIPV